MLVVAMSSAKISTHQCCVRMKPDEAVEIHVFVDNNNNNN